MRASKDSHAAAPAHHETMYGHGGFRSHARTRRSFSRAPFPAVVARWRARSTRIHSPPMSPADAASAALDALLARFADMVRQVSWRHGLPPEDVDEIFQEVRIRLWQAKPDGENLSALGSSYVYRTA